MSALNETIQTRQGGTFGAYVARPANPNGNAIVLLQEIFGVTSTIRRVADRYAQDGYLVYAPDLFWRMKPGIELSHSKEDIATAMSLLAKYDDDEGIGDIAQTIAHIRALPDFTGKVAVAGLCMGGKLAYLSCTQTDADAGVAYYGVGIDKFLDRAKDLRCPIILHFGRKDDYVPPSAQEAIARTFADQPLATTHFYEDAGHGFYTRGAAEDAQVAHERTEAFLQQSFSEQMQ